MISDIWGQLSTSPLLVALLGLMYVCRSIGTLYIETDKAVRLGELPANARRVPDGFVIFPYLGWILTITVIFINWKVGVFVRLAIWILETTPIVGVLGLLPQSLIMMVTEMLFARPSDLDQQGH